MRSLIAKFFLCKQFSFWVSVRKGKVSFMRNDKETFHFSLPQRLVPLKRLCNYISISLDNIKHRKLFTLLRHHSKKHPAEHISQKVFGFCAALCSVFSTRVSWKANRSSRNDISFEIPIILRFVLEWNERNLEFAMKMYKFRVFGTKLKSNFSKVMMTILCLMIVLWFFSQSCRQIDAIDKEKYNKKWKKSKIKIVHNCAADFWLSQSSFLVRFISYISNFNSLGHRLLHHFSMPTLHIRQRNCFVDGKKSFHIFVLFNECMRAFFSLLLFISSSYMNNHKFSEVSFFVSYFSTVKDGKLYMVQKTLYMSFKKLKFHFLHREQKNCFISHTSIGTDFERKFLRAIQYWKLIFNYYLSQKSSAH